VLRSIGEFTILRQLRSVGIQLFTGEDYVVDVPGSCLNPEEMAPT
jgi:hypothetical protein